MKLALLLIAGLLVIGCGDNDDTPAPADEPAAEQEADPQDRGTQFSGDDADAYNQARDECAQTALDQLGRAYDVPGAEQVREERYSDRDFEWAGQIERAVAERIARDDPPLVSAAGIGCLDGFREREVVPGPAPRRP